MLYEVITNGEDINYIPTTLGKVLLAVVFIALLAAAAFFSQKRTAGQKPAQDSGQKTVSRKSAAKQLAFCAAAIALGTLLSNLKIYDFPFGGSVTLFSMLVICLPGYWFGLKAGLITGVAYGVLQLIIDPYVIHPLQLLVDYPLAFGAFGLSGLFTDKKHGLPWGYALGIIGRWIFATLSGWIFFAEYAWEGWAPLPYSLVYNGIYIFTEAAVTYAVLAVPHVRHMLAGLKRLAAAP